MFELEAEVLDQSLSKFVTEIRRQDGEEYTSTTLHNIVCGLLRYMRDGNVINKNFLDTKDQRFREFRKTLDSRMKFLVSKYQCERKQADPITREDEEILRNSVN